MLVQFSMFVCFCFTYKLEKLDLEIGSDSGMISLALQQVVFCSFIRRHIMSGFYCLLILAAIDAQYLDSLTLLVVTQLYFII